MDIVHKKHIKQVLGYISSVGEKFTEYFFMETFVFQGLSIIDVRLGKLELNDFSPVVYDQMKFEAKEPYSHLEQIHGLIESNQLDVDDLFAHLYRQ
jgi:hypothetical protein